METPNHLSYGALTLTPHLKDATPPLPFRTIGRLESGLSVELSLHSADMDYGAVINALTEGYRMGKSEPISFYINVSPPSEEPAYKKANGKAFIAMLSVRERYQITDISVHFSLYW